MKNNSQFVVISLELHLFFARIMKEHALFMEAAFTPADADCAKDAGFYRQEFEKLLFHTVSLSNGIVGQRVLDSGEVVTEFTLCAEQQTEKFTGIDIDQEITKAESRLRCGEDPFISMEMYSQVRWLNQKAMESLNGLIAFKESVLEKVLECKMFTMNYPLLIEHIIREAKLYRSFLSNLENGRSFDGQSMRQTEEFWNQIMMEHALFIRGLLDPTENDLIRSADSFANDYARLLTESREKCDRTIVNDTKAALKETVKFRDFKMAGTQGIEECRIRSVILPLLADHVLREANHYIRLLTE